MKRRNKEKNNWPDEDVSSCAEEIPFDGAAYLQKVRERDLKVNRLKEEMEILLGYGFHGIKEADIEEMQQHCMNDNFPHFQDTFLIPRMSFWREKNENASSEEETNALRGLIKTVSQDYKYGRVDKKEMPTASEERKAEEALLNREMSNKEYYSKYVETQEDMMNQSETIIEQIQKKVLEIEAKESLKLRFSMTRGTLGA